MTVQELIDRLQSFDPNIRVVVPGFDQYGYSDISQVLLSKVESSCIPMVDFFTTNKEGAIEVVAIDYCGGVEES